MTNRYRYSTPDTENTAKALGVSLAISTKKSIEICNSIRGKPIAQAKKILTNAITLKHAIPMNRFNKDTGHKHGMAAGRYAASACKDILSILASAEANAQYKGLSTNDLIVHHISAQKGPTTWHHGRHQRRQAKRTHLELMLQEIKQPPSEQKQK